MSSKDVRRRKGNALLKSGYGTTWVDESQLALAQHYGVQHTTLCTVRMRNTSWLVYINILDASHSIYYRIGGLGPDSGQQARREMSDRTAHGGRSTGYESRVKRATTKRWGKLKNALFCGVAGEADDV